MKRVDRKNANGSHAAELEALDDAVVLVTEHLHALQNKHYKEVAKAMGRPLEAVMQGMDFIRTLDPRPGLRYNKAETRLIEPDVAFVKQGDEYLVLMNDEEVPQLRLNPTYRRLLSRDVAEKDVRNYVKERYKSAIQLIKNIEQRKQTILRVCYSILERQRDFLDHGIDQSEADDDQGSGGGDRRASLDRQPRRGQQVCSHPARRLRTPILLQRERQRS